MSTDFCKPSSAPKTMRQYFKTQEEHRRENNRIEGHVYRARDALKWIFGRDVMIDDVAIRVIVTKKLSDQHYWKANKEAAAAHEVGHYVAFELEGFVAHTAKINGSSFGYHGWSGEAVCCKPLQIGYGHPPLSATDFARLARVTLAGPVAGDLHGGDCALTNVGELLEARIYSDRAADLCNMDRDSAWKNNVCQTVGIVEYHEHAIADLSKILWKRRKINRSSRSVVRILMGLQPIKSTRLSINDDPLVRRICGQTPSVINCATWPSP